MTIAEIAPRSSATIAVHVDEATATRSERERKLADLQRELNTKRSDLLVLDASRELGDKVAPEAVARVEHRITQLEREIRPIQPALDREAEILKQLEAELVRAREREHEALRERNAAQRLALRSAVLEAVLTFLRLGDVVSGLWREDAADAYALRDFLRSRGITRHVSIVQSTGRDLLAEQMSAHAHFLAKELGLELDTTTWTASSIAAADDEDAE